MPHKTTYTEPELLSRLRNHDADAFTAVYETHYKLLFFHARKYISPEAAEDLLADVFIKLHNTPFEFESIAHLRNWLHITVHNACVNILRDTSRHKLHEQNLAEQINEEQQRLLLNSEIESTFYERVQKAIDALPPRQRTILTMSFLQEKDNAAIAQDLNISVQSVKNQKVTALKTLRSQFTKDELLMIGCLLYTGQTVFS